MATITLQRKLHQQVEEEEEEEEEALSLSDLPVTLINREQKNEEHTHHVNTKQEEFDFHSWSGFFSKEPEMCVADEVFFQGQILPSRLSFSSEAGLLTSAFQPEAKQFINCSESRSKSLDHVSTSGFQSSSSSRSSSISSTSSTMNTTTIKPKIRNQFHTHPSPKPQLKPSGPRHSSFGNNRKSIFRLGVVPFPEIELQNLKARCNSTNKINSVSRNSSSSSSSSNSAKSSNKSKTHHDDKRNNHVLKQLIGKGGGLLSGCDCSFDAVQSEKVMISKTHAEKEKVKEMKTKQREKQGLKKGMSRRRTFEWLKELHESHHQEEQALLSEKKQ